MNVIQSKPNMMDENTDLSGDMLTLGVDIIPYTSGVILVCSLLITGINKHSGLCCFNNKICKTYTILMKYLTNLPKYV